jgi:hypothetical protein
LGVTNYTSEDAPNAAYVNVWPFVHNNYTYYGTDEHKWYIQLQTALDGSYSLFPCVVCGTQPEINYYGELEGCFAVPGFGLATEDVIDNDGDEYIAFQNIWRSEKHEFWALKKE